MLNNVTLSEANNIFDGFLSTKFDDIFVPEVVSSIIIMLIIAIICIIVFFKAKKST